MSVWAVVVAGGSGERFGALKQFAMLGGRPLYQWALDAARPAVDGMVLVVPAGSSPSPSGAARVVEGGATRSASVRAGLEAVPGDADLIVVHDAARPLATTALFRAVIAGVRAGADAAIPALAVADTLKMVRHDVVVRTVPRHGVVAVQTPQAFSSKVLRAAHAAGGEATDDAALVEEAGATVRVVPGDPRNLKVTTPAELELVQALVGGAR